MFKKIPYGVKVRVRGNEQDGFIAEYALYCARFTPFLDNWSIIRNYPSGNVSFPLNTFATFELAKEAAMEQYDSWIKFYERKQEEERISVRIAKSQRSVVWKHP